MKTRRRFAVMAGGLLAAVATAIPGVATAAPRQDPAPESVALHFESKIGELGDGEFAEQALATLNDPRGWGQAGFSFRSDPSSPYRVVLAEPAEVDALCLPLVTGGRVSCQNGEVVAINANRWRNATDDWDKGPDAYRQYVVNHEVGHLIGQFHPANRCPRPGEPEAVMAQQTKGLEGCQGNPWPLDWEILGASKRPVGYAPTPDVEPDVRATNPGGGVPGTAAPATTAVSTPTTTAATATTEQAPAEEAPAAVGDEAETPEGDDAAGDDGPLEESASGGRSLEKVPLSGLATDAPRSDDGSSLPAIIVLGFLAVTLVSLGVALLVRWRSHRGEAWEHPGDGGDPEFPATALAVNAEHTEGWESELVDDLSGWSVELGGGAGRSAGVTWVTPTRWTPEQSSEFVSAIAELDPHTVEPDALAARMSGVLRARRDLRPREGEGLGVIVVGSTQLVAAALGAAEVVERRGAQTKSTRRQGVVRLRGGGDGPLQVTLTQSGNDWPIGSVTVVESAEARDSSPHDSVTEEPSIPGQ